MRFLPQLQKQNYISRNVIRKHEPNQHKPNQHKSNKDLNQNQKSTDHFSTSVNDLGGYNLRVRPRHLKLPWISRGLAAKK